MNSAGRICTGPMSAHSTRLANAMGSAPLLVHVTMRNTPAAKPTKMMTDVTDAPSFLDTVPDTRLMSATMTANTERSVAANEAVMPLPTKK